MDLTERVIALLILLYAQPLSRIVRLTIDDVIHDGDQVFIRLGDPPVPIPGPFAEVLTYYVANRSNLTTATNPTSRLLFPGRRAGQSLHPTSIATRLRRLGIPNLNAYLDFSNGPSGMGPPMVAAMAIAAGACEMALAYRTLPQRQGNNARVSESTQAFGPAQYTDVYGHAVGILANYALKKRRRMAELGRGPEEYGLISINAHRWAALNERALFATPLTMEQYLESRVIVDPLLIYDCDYPINGSCALLITTAERARSGAQRWPARRWRYVQLTWL